MTDFELVQRLNKINSRLSNIEKAVGIEEKRSYTFLSEKEYEEFERWLNYKRTVNSSTSRIIIVYYQEENTWYICCEWWEVLLDELTNRELIKVYQSL